MTSLKTYIQFLLSKLSFSLLFKRQKQHHCVVEKHGKKLPKSRAGGEGGVTQEAYKFLSPYLLTPVWEFVLLCHELTMKFQRTIFIKKKESIVRLNILLVPCDPPHYPIYLHQQVKQGWS